MKKTILLTLLLSFGCIGVIAQTSPRTSIPLKHGAHRIGKRTDSDMQRWRKYGLGQFIHWGVYSIPGGRWNGEIYKGDSAAEGIRYWYEIGEDGKRYPKKFDGVLFREIYDKLYQQFNPNDFDAKRWAKQAKEMGVKYLIFTTKHHDGFCMWPSKYTDYNISNTPYKKDIVGEIIDAYNKEGIDVVLYFSILDWHFKGNYEEFKTFTRNQVLELADRYPQAKGFWFDGTWLSEWKKQGEFADLLGQELRNKIPGLIIGNRFRPDEYGKIQFDSNGDLIDDYDQSWEREIPASIEQLNGNDWECVMTVPENQWGYADWSWMYVKKPSELIEMMSQVVSLGGNFVVNFGPDSNGNLRPEEMNIAKEMGKWMKINSEAIHGTSHIDLKKQNWGYYTQKGDKVYMIVSNRPVNNMLRIEIGKDKNIAPEKSYFLADSKELTIESAGKNKKGDDLYNITLPKSYVSDEAFVIVMEIKKK